MHVVEILQKVHLIADADGVNALRGIIQEQQLDWSVHIVVDTSDGFTSTSEAITSGASLVVVAGSDATISDVINGLYLSDVPLAMLPHPRSHAFVASSSTPNNMTALRQIAQQAGRVLWMDLAKVNERFLAGHAAVGKLSPSLSQSFVEYPNGLVGLLRAVLERTPQAIKHSFDLTLDNGHVRTTGYIVLVANMNIMGVLNRELSQPIHADDSLLDIFVVHERWRDNASLVNDNKRSRVLSHYRSRNVKISAGEELPVLLDGVRRDASLIEVTVVPKALRLFVPDESVT